MNKILSVSLTICLLIFLSACNSSSSSSGNSSSSSSGNQKRITVVDGYIVNAVVKDQQNIIIGTTNTNGYVDIPQNMPSITYPICSIGGFIDVDGNGIYEKGTDIEIPEYVELCTTKGSVISPLTTLIYKGIKPEKLSLVSGIPVDRFFIDPIGVNDVIVEKMNQIAYTLLASKNDENFIYLVNNVGAGDLPVFGDGVKVENGSLNAVLQLALKSTADNPTAQDLIVEIVHLQVQSAAKIEEAIKPLKEEIHPISNGGGNSNSTGNMNNVGGSNVSVNISASSISNQASSSVGFSSQSSALPNLNDHTNIIQSSSSQQMDLPTFGNTTASSSSPIISSSSYSSSSVSNGADIPSFSYQ